jgi:hypothetical protein
MKKFEQQFEAHLKALAGDANSACIFVYTELTLHHFFGADYDLRDRVNPHAGFWNGVLAALQSAGFMAIGRMYDEDAGAHTIKTLLDFTKTYKGVFRPSALEERRIHGGMPPEAAKEFAKGTFALAAEDLDQIYAEYDVHRRLYKEKIEPIRHNVFAHAGRMTKNDRDALFTKLFVRKLEEIVVFPLRVHRALFGLYHNGLDLAIESPPTNVVHMLEVLPDKFTNSWEHLHAVANAARLLLWMKEAPVPESPLDPALIARLVKAMELEKIGLTDADFTDDPEAKDSAQGSEEE